MADDGHRCPSVRMGSAAFPPGCETPPLPMKQFRRETANGWMGFTLERNPMCHVQMACNPRIIVFLDNKIIWLISPCIRIREEAGEPLYVLKAKVRLLASYYPIQYILILIWK